MFSIAFEFGLTEYQWSQVECKLRTHPSAIRLSRYCDEFFIDQLKSGKFTCDDTFVPKAWIPFSVVYKGGKYRVVFNYTFPENGISVNSQVSDEYAHVKLPYAREVAKLVKKAGTNGYLAKADLKSAFRQIALAKKDDFKCAYKWRGRTLIEHFMPWGTRAASAQCQLMGETIVYLMNKELPVNLRNFAINYIDDFIFAGTNKENCKRVIDMFFQVCKKYIFKVKESKTEWPAQEMLLLGYHYNCKDQTVSIGKERETEWLVTLNSVLNNEFILYKTLDSLIGKLEFGAPVVYPMKCCIRRFRNAMPKIRNPETRIKITSSMRHEAALWIKFLPILNGVDLDDVIGENIIDKPIELDASNIGCGAFNEPHWFIEFFNPWEVESSKIKNNIARREMFVINCAFEAWGSEWHGRRILFNTDNKTVESELAKKDSKNDNRMNLIRNMCFLAAKHKFRFYVRWVSRNDNHFADLLSKNNFNGFKMLCIKSNRTFDKEPTKFNRPRF